MEALLARVSLLGSSETIDRIEVDGKGEKRRHEGVSKWVVRRVFCSVVLI